MTETVPRRVVLHIGLHKTGTTWTQAVLHRSRPALLAQGIDWPAFGPNHGWPLIHMVTPAEELAAARLPFRRRRQAAPARLARHREELRRALEGPAPTVLISSEHLSQLPRPRVEALVELLAASGRRVEAIAYLREPLSWAGSMAQQRLKLGASLAELRAAPPLPAWRRRLRPWLRTLGEDAVATIPWDRAAMPRGDVARDLLARLGADPETPLAPAPPIRANRAVSERAARALDLRNRLAARLVADPDARRPRLFRLLALLPGPPFRLPPEARAKVAEAAAPELAWLERRLGRPPFPPAPPR